MSIGETLLSMPVATFFAAFGYFFFLLALVWPAMRRQAGLLLALPAPSNQAHLAALDAFRGLAALWVASFHYWQWPRNYFDPAGEAAPFILVGWYGVPFFVALSGFLVYRAARTVNSSDQLKVYVRN